jgi:hypothetical protein
VAITTIIREVQLHAPKHRYCKLSYHAHRHSSRPNEHTACWMQMCSTAGVVENCGNGAVMRWQWHNSWHIYWCVCVCWRARANAFVQCMRGKRNINKRARTHTYIHNKIGSGVIEGREMYRKMSARFGDNCMKI